MITFFDNVPLSRLLFYGAAVRAVMLLYAAFHDATFRVKYTDIDYAVITDGATAMAQGGSPFERATFRYTPLLSALMLPNVWIWHHFGKLFFCACDVFGALFCYSILVTFVKSATAKRMIALFILFNPIVINVSTRGNSDMVITFLTFAVLWLFSRQQFLGAACVLGFAAHFKLYPVIYAAPLVFGLLQKMIDEGRRVSWFLITTILCGVGTVIGFAVPTYLCGVWYGQEYYDEALLYHFGRSDHRHNLSPYWYMMYLNMARLPGDVDYSSTLIAFIPQLLMLTLVGWKLRKNVPQAVCIETLLFVAFNKVCTVQYFVWYIPLLPFIFADLSAAKAKQLGGLLTTPVCVGMALLWFGSLILWMLVAMQLEFNGCSVFFALWACSCFYFVAQVVVAAWLSRISLRLQNGGGESSPRGRVATPMPKGKKRKSSSSTRRTRK